jgi:hypothetical protein
LNQRKRRRLKGDSKTGAKEKGGSFTIKTIAEEEGRTIKN